VRVVLAVKPHLPTPGGAQYTSHWLALELQRRGHEVIVVADQQRRGPAEPGFTTRWGYPVRNAWDAPAELARLLAEEGADCVVVGGYGELTDALTRGFLAAASGAPTLFYLHDVRALLHLERGGAAAGLAGSFPDVRIAAVSEFLAGEVERRGLRCVVLPPIADPRDYAVPTSRELALFVNPIPSKGLDLVLALARARPERPFALTRCWWMPGESLAALRATVAELPNVELRDPVGSPEELYGDARVLLAPSRYPEAWGRVVSEAQASGIPAIAADVGGLREAVGSGGGILLPADAGVPDWAQALDGMWHEPGHTDWSRRAAAQARRAGLTAAAIADRFEAVIEAVASTRRDPPAPERRPSTLPQTT
jgi:glycosyltransferase involved in cell wall biosynthesis